MYIMRFSLPPSMKTSSKPFALLFKSLMPYSTIDILVVCTVTHVTTISDVLTTNSSAECYHHITEIKCCGWLSGRNVTLSSLLQRDITRVLCCLKLWELLTANNFFKQILKNKIQHLAYLHISQYPNSMQKNDSHTHKCIDIYCPQKVL